MPPLLAGSNESDSCKVEKFIFDWIFFAGECLETGLKQNKSDLGYQVLYCLIELLQLPQVPKFMTSEDMVPKQLASMQERILPPLNHYLLLDRRVALRDQARMQVFEFGDPVGYLHAMFLPLIPDPGVDIVEESEGGGGVGLREQIEDSVPDGLGGD